MKSELTELICCPQCGGSLQIETTETKDGEIWEGTLTCAPCAAAYPVQKGLPHLHLNDESWTAKAVEAEGWVTYHQNLGIYEIVADSVDLKIPYYPEEPWIGVARSFDLALAELKLTGEETILDLGAGRGWAAKEFAKRGCRVVALDVVSDENVGLGRAKALMDHAGVYFDRLIGDGERLPFFADSFDLVFCAAALHHSSNLPLFLANIGKVLKRNGRLCAINEPCISVANNEQKTLARDAAAEMDVGINETRPNLIGYEQALRHAGLRPIKLAPARGMTLDKAALDALSRHLGAKWPKLGTLIHAPRQFLGQLDRYITARLSAVRKGAYFQARQLAAAHPETAVETAILLWSGGELFIMAQKP